MSIWILICMIMGACFLLGIGVYGIFQERRAAKTVARLNEMLNLAINGDFTETTFDESTLSALESKINHYLSQSTVSSKNLAAEKNKIETLISDISHQTKTPIANILLYSQLLEESDLPDSCEESVKALSSQAEKLSFLIGTLVKTSRLETGIITVSPQENQIMDLLDIITEQIEAKAAAKDIKIEKEDTATTAVFDEKWTAEALYNILDNAVKYTPNHGTVTIKVQSHDIFCAVEIRDNGIGIEEREHPKIFARFYRSPQVMAEEGVGIGLFLAREIIAAQGGYIKVKSKVGEGSAFSVFLPKS